MLNGIRPGAGKRPRVTQFIEKTSDPRFKAFDIIRGHLSPPVSQARSNGLLVMRDFPALYSLESLVIIEHRLVIRQA